MKRVISIRLSDGQRDRLSQIAKNLNCTDSTDQPSLSRLIQLIADDFLFIGRHIPKGATSKKEEKEPERKPWKWHQRPPQWWDVVGGLVELDEIKRRTGLERDELGAGWKCTETMARAPWPTYGPKLPDWWMDSDSEPGMLLKDVPDGEDPVALGLLVVGDLVLAPEGPAVVLPPVVKAPVKKGGRK